MNKEVFEWANPKGEPLRHERYPLIRIDDIKPYSAEIAKRSHSATLIRSSSRPETNPQNKKEDSRRSRNKTEYNS